MSLRVAYNGPPRRQIGLSFIVSILPSVQIASRTWNSRTSPMTRVDLLRPSSSTLCTMHSMLTGADEILGVAIRTPGSVGMPSSSVSLTPGGCSTALPCSCGSKGMSARFTTNSSRARMLRAVSFSSPPRRPMLMATIGGSLPTKVNELNGAALTLPSAPSVVTQAIGLGTTTPVISL